MPLQKSFSDQNHTNKQPRPHWHRHNSYQGTSRAAYRNTTDRRPDTQAVPLLDATKRKLNNFQFTHQTNDERPTTLKKTIAPSTLEDKENTEGLPTAKHVEQEKSQEDKIASHKSPRTAKDVPMTPAAKLALLDVFEITNPVSVEEKISPEERLLWHHDKAMMNGTYSAIKKKSRKRARSSSPTGSPNEMFSRRGSETVFDLEQLTQSLKTPKGDHKVELWDRNALNAIRTTPQTRPTPALAHIMYTSSPQPREASAQKYRSLKKATSCGIDWPKRRKFDTEVDERDDVFSGAESGRSKSAMINALLEKVQEGMANSTGSEIEDVSSSSPLPQTKRSRDPDLSSSPLGHPPRHELEIAVERLPEHPTVDRPSKTVKSGSLGSSDYGDFSEGDIDVAMLDAADARMNTPNHAFSKTVSGDTLVEEATEDAQEKREKKGPPSDKHTDPISLDGDDEFDDSDEDEFAAELEDLASKFDSSVESTLAKVDTKSGAALTGLPPAASTQKSPPKEIVEISSDDEFGDDLDDIDFDEAEAMATQALQKPSDYTTSPKKVRIIQRYLITKVIISQYETPQRAVRSEKLLIVIVENTNVTRTVHLRDGWVDTQAHERAFVHIIGEFNNGECVIDDSQGMIILHPDHLISSTVVADSFTCVRRAVLQDRVKATSEATQPLVYGTILHEIFQAALLENKWDTKWLDGMMETICTRHLEDLYMIQTQIPQAIAYLRSKIGEVQAWAELFVTSKPKPEAKVKAGNGDTSVMCVSKLLDVEEHVWSPMYGLKGNIDATVQITMQDGKLERNLTAPFEVKTGRNANPSHRAQTALYNLLLSDRYDIEIAYGILYYMESSETIRIPTIRHEVRHMIMQRNELSTYVRERDTQLPPMLKRENLCNRCYAKTSCFIYHKLADDGDGESSGMREKFDEIVKHLTSKHKEFFLKWETLLTKEEKESLKFRRELWTMQSSEREKLGRCFANVIVEPGSAYEEKGNPKINRFRYTLVKEKPQPGFSFLDSQIIVGEPIVISDEQGHYALANGYATNVRKDRITVEVDRRLHNARIRQPDFDEVNNQTFASIMEVASEGSTPEQSKGKIVEQPIVYRLDKDEFSNGMATVRNNLIQVMSDGPFGSRKIRKLVVDLMAPSFKPQASQYTLANSDTINVDQKKAIEKVMSAEDYALVLGMPGTGKTTTIAHIIRALVSMGKTVLLTSYTHTAVDNILLKLQDDNIPILRLGAISKINKDVQGFAKLAVTPKKTMEELRSDWHDTPIVATTCLGVNHPIFNERIFDYCIVDEASQITLPVCLGPIRMAHRFILVGDHNQLPPLVQNEEARVGGLDVSLFKLLSDVHPSSVVNLEHQYRMCEEVMTLSNRLIYNGRLKCGTPEVAARSIDIPHMERLKLHHHDISTLSHTQKSVCATPSRHQCWLYDMLDPSTKVSFINTDPLLPSSREEAKGNRIVNPTEATLCAQIVEGLLTVGVPASSIGVMTHYRSQLALIRHNLRGHSDIEMHTADRFQGRDKEVVILSLVRNNEAKSIGDLLKDWRRINVAFTRAKTKLLVIGSRDTLKGKTEEDGPVKGEEEMVARFIKLMEEKGWIYDLPKHALESHNFDAAVTQVSSTAGFAASSQWNKVNEKDGKNDGVVNKENRLREPRKAKLGERAIMAGRPVLRDIMNDIAGR